MNIIVMSISNKVPLIKAIREQLASFPDGAIQLYGADSSSSGVGKYFVDQFWQCPRLNELSIAEFIAYCQQHSIRFVIPTRDGELPYFSQHKQVLEENGIFVMVSAEEEIKRSLDKYEFSNCYSEQENYTVIPTFKHFIKDGVTYVVKERYGAGSKLLGLNLNAEEATKFANQLQSPVFQPYIKGEEYSLDGYVGKNGLVGVVVRRRELVVDGESQITTTVSHSKLEDVMRSFVEKSHYYGHMMLQVLEDEDGQLHIIECNSRIGGASTLSFAVGLRSVEWFIRESMGDTITCEHFHRSSSQKRLIRHKEDWII